MMNRRPPFAMAVVVLAAISSSSGHVAAQSSLAPPNWDEGVRLAEASDRNPDPDVVELDITAKLADVRIGATVVKAWTYNGGIPGPFIRAKVGDRLIVHFTNELAEPTTIHWHGVRVPIQMDGVPGISQAEVKAGERFTYDFVLKDAGLYWYHPHVMSAAQVGYGLYGALLIEDAGDGVGVADALTLVLSDIGFDSRGVLEPADSGGSAGTVFGREGATVLVNGKSNPRLLARAGAPQRWRIVNTAKSRYFLLDLDGQPFTVVGSDGGLQETAQPKEQLLVTPGERFDVIVAPTGAPGSELVLRSMLYNRGYGSVEFRSVETLMTIAFSAEAALPKPTTRVAPRTVTPPPLSGATPVELTFTLPPVDAKGHSEFRVNGVPFWKATPFRSALGETQLWVMKNDTQWDHPFHLHGFFFMPVDEKLLPLHPMVWKDTINVPMKTTVRFLVTFDERPGTWMFHCHILDHAESGLMGSVHVGDGEPAVHSTHPQL
jgi:FtsP/CotA-like multicopper oxidase with cupredoxin domain